jgi:hypothetical protein
VPAQPATEGRDTAAEGSAPPVEPQESVIRLIPDDTPTVRNAPVLPTPEPPAPGTVIVAVKIPAPQPPRRLVTPPAATTAGALIRQTQTSTPAKPEPTPEAPAADQAPTPPPEAAAPDASSPKEEV